MNKIYFVVVVAPEASRCIRVVPYMEVCRTERDKTNIFCLVHITELKICFLLSKESSRLFFIKFK